MRKSYSSISDKIVFHHSAGKGVSAPLTLIIVTLALLSVTSAMCAESFNALSSTVNDPGFSTAPGFTAIHDAIEKMSGSPVGTSESIFVFIASGSITIGNGGVCTDGPLPSGIDDYAHIVRSISEKCVSYNGISLTEAVIGPGTSKVVLTVGPFNDPHYKKILVEVTRQ